jgi:hypothetical protein
MSFEVLILGLFSGLRPGTSLAAVLVLLRAPEPRRPLLFFSVAGFASSWVIGMLVVAVFHGAEVAVGGSRLAAILDIVFGAAALGFAAGLHQGWVQPRAHRTRSAPASGTSSRFRRLRGGSLRLASAAGIGTHVPGLVYLVALNAIAADRPGLVDAAVQIALYDTLWFLIPLVSLVLVIARPGAAPRYLEAATAWVRRHEYEVLVAGSLVLGLYLVAKGTVNLLT